MDGLLGDLGTWTETARIRLLQALVDHELGVGELCRIVQLPQSTVSRHLKTLQVGGWIRRRSEGTSGLYRADLDSLEPRRLDLWRLVREEFSRTLLAEEDRLRLEAVLVQRDGGSFFHRRHAEWDAMRRELFGEQFAAAAWLALLAPGLRIADLGCGTGPALVELAPSVARVIGIDREPRMLEVARERTAAFPNVELRQGGVEDPPLAPGEVDAAVCLLVLHHVSDLEAAFVGVHRSLVPGGRFVVVDMTAHDRADWLHTMGHHHLGFEPRTLLDPARRAGFAHLGWRALPPAAEAQGPPLFVAAWSRP